MGELEGLGSAAALVQIIILPPASVVTLGMLLCLSGPQFLHVWMGSAVLTQIQWVILSPAGVLQCVYIPYITLEGGACNVSIDQGEGKLRPREPGSPL